MIIAMLMSDDTLTSITRHGNVTLVGSVTSEL